MPELKGAQKDSENNCHHLDCMLQSLQFTIVNVCNITVNKNNEAFLPSTAQMFKCISLPDNRTNPLKWHYLCLNQCVWQLLVTIFSGESHVHESQQLRNSTGLIQRAFPTKHPAVERSFAWTIAGCSNIQYGRICLTVKRISEKVGIWGPHTRDLKQCKNCFDYVTSQQEAMWTSLAEHGIF